MAPARCHPSADTQCPCYCAQFARGRPNCRSPRALEQLTAKCTWNYWNHPVDRPGARSRASSRHPRLVPPPGRPLRAMPVPEAETAPSAQIHVIRPARSEVVEIGACFRAPSAVGARPGRLCRQLAIFCPQDSRTGEWGRRRFERPVLLPGPCAGEEAASRGRWRRCADGKVSGQASA